MLSSQSGAPLQHLTQLVLQGRPTGHGARIPLSPELRLFSLDVDFAEDGALELPPLLEEVAVGPHVTKPFALPLPPGLRIVAMRAQRMDNIDDVALWRKEFVENLPAGVDELCLSQALTCSDHDFGQEPDDIAWPDTIRSLVLDDWDVRMDLPPSVSALSLKRATADTLLDMINIITPLNPLEVLYVSSPDWSEENEESSAGMLATWGEVRLPATLKNLLLGPDINKQGVQGMLQHGLPPALEEFIVDEDSDFNAPLTAFPPTLRVLHLNANFNSPLANIPDGLEEAVLPMCKRQVPLPPAACVSYI